MKNRKTKSQLKKGTKKFKVLNAENVVIETNNILEVESAVQELKNNGVEQIFVRDYEDNCQFVHTKGRYEKNYRIRTEKFTPEEPIPDETIENQNTDLDTTKE